MDKNGPDQSAAANTKIKQPGRSITGVLLLDKPTGHTSNSALQRVKRIYGALKAGHTGSLDSIATGMLPVCFGRATRLSGLLLDADKRYRVWGRLGQVTDTGDREGSVLRVQPVPPLTAAAVEQVLDNFRGEIAQVPPMYSAIKHQGKRLYQLARAGVSVERKSRQLTIYQLTLEELSEDHICLFVHCSKGTYIRTLVEDIGNRIGCGAMVMELRRLSAGPFPEAEMISMDRLVDLRDDKRALDALLLPPERIVPDYPALRVTVDDVGSLRRGKTIFAPATLEAGGVCLYGPGNRLLGLGQVSTENRVRLTVRL